jgi:hypothetical protein
MAMSSVTPTTGLVLEYDSGILPPPFSHVFRLSLDWSKLGLQAQLDLHYTDREELSEQEILDEGFGLDGDYRFDGKIATVWIRPLQDLLKSTRWTKKSIEEGGITLSTLEQGKPQGVKIPVNQEEWQLMAQDLIQAIYETEKKEAPLTIQYRKVAQDQPTDIGLTVHFSTREVILTKGETSKTIPWEKSLELMKLVFMPDYRYELAKEEPGTKRGAFIECGDGYWHELGKGVINSHPSFDAVGKIRAGFDQLLEG